MSRFLARAAELAHVPSVWVLLAPYAILGVGCGVIAAAHEAGL